MYSRDEYNVLKKKYGAYSSWAIWDYQKESETSVIDDNYIDLGVDYIFLGLNISATLGKESWVNFHGGKHDRKLKYACNDTKLRGSYITDLFKDLPEAKSQKLIDQLTTETIKENVKKFNQEMDDIKICKNSKFIIFGTQDSHIARLFTKYFNQDHNNPVIYYYHYSFYGLTDEKWVQGLWAKLRIKGDYGEIIRKYKLK